MTGQQSLSDTDGDEIICQTCTQELDPEQKAGIIQVSVSMDCAGSIDDQVLIQNLYNLDMRSTDVVGLFGAPVEIETEAEFDTADIIFTYIERNRCGKSPYYVV